MPKNLIYLCQNKLLGINKVTPILMRIKSICPKTKVVIVFMSDRHMNQVKTNHEIWKAIHALNPDIISMRGKGRLPTIIRLAKFIKRFAFKENIFLIGGSILPFHKTTMKVLKKLSKVTEIKSYVVAQFPIFLKNIYRQSAVWRERIGKPMRLNLFSEDFDYFLSALSVRQLKEAANIDIPQQKIIRYGYTYKFPEWREFIAECVERNKVINSGPYFFYILHTVGQRFQHLNEPDLIELIEESLSVLKKYNTKIKTIFKPHTITDMGKLQEVLNKLDYSNYIIDHSYPMVLASKAKFVFGNVFSSIMFDAYYLGRPTVEYCQYDPEILKRLDGRSVGGEFVDFFIYRDKEKLDEVLNKLINEEAKVERDPKFIRENYGDTPQEFYEFWHNLLS